MRHTQYLAIVESANTIDLYPIRALTKEDAHAIITKVHSNEQRGECTVTVHEIDAVPWYRLATIKKDAPRIATYEHQQE